MVERVEKRLHEQVTMLSDQFLNLTDDPGGHRASRSQDFAIGQSNGEREARPTHCRVWKAVSFLCVEVDRPATITAGKRWTHRAASLRLEASARSIAAAASSFAGASTWAYTSAVTLMLEQPNISCIISGPRTNDSACPARDRDLALLGDAHGKNSTSSTFASARHRRWWRCRGRPVRRGGSGAARRPQSAGPACSRLQTLIPPKRF